MYCGDKEEILYNVENTEIALAGKFCCSVFIAKSDNL